jgi:hypothetical protein
MATTLWNWTMSASLLSVAVSGGTAQAEEFPFLPPPQPVPASAEVSEPTEVPPSAGPVVKRETPLADEVCEPPNQSARQRQMPPHGYPQQRPPLDRGFPERLNPPPLGSTVRRFQMLQIAHGQAARMALHQYDFLANSDQLNASGQRQLGRIAHWATFNDFPIFIEPVRGCPELTELRRQVVWQQLSQIHGEFPGERLVIGSPGGRGLDAMDALSIDRNLQEMTNSRGIQAGGDTATSISGDIGTSDRADN